MAINSKIILSKGIRLDKDYNNVLTISHNALLEIMTNSTHLVYQAQNYSFIDEFQNIINVQVPYGDCIAVNYMAYQNPRYNNKWFFCFVDKIEYNSEKSTNITFHVDSWETWYNQFSFKNCYVIREHVLDDTIGKHTVQEDLPVQEVVLDDSVTVADSTLDSSLHVAVTCSWAPDTQTGWNGVVAYNKNIFGSNIYCFELTDSGIYNLENFLYIVGAQQHSDDINNIFIIPSFLIPSGSYTTITCSVEGPYGTVTASAKQIRYDSSYAYLPYTKSISISKNTSFTDYTCKNNKCYCYPYNYLLCSNNVGSTNIYKYEDFNSTTCDFELQMALSVGCSGRLVPKKYKIKGASVSFSNIDESITLAKYPTCEWDTDSYTNWLTQNAVNVTQKYLGDEASGKVRDTTMFFTNTFMGFLGDKIAKSNLPDQLQSILGVFSKSQLLPGISGGQASGDVNYANSNQSPIFMKMRAKKEFLEILDDYFSRFRL